MKTVTRYHDISAGHRVVGDAGKCQKVHGHNYRIFFTCTAPELDHEGRVIDFGVMKDYLCDWVEGLWDHALLLWNQDPLASFLTNAEDDRVEECFNIVLVPFNPTAENMAQWLLENGDCRLLMPVRLIAVTVQETRKCSATATSEDIVRAIYAEEG